MPTSKYRVVINNADRGTGRRIDFAILHDARKYFDSHRLYPGETIEIQEIGDRPKSSVEPKLDLD